MARKDFSDSNAVQAAVELAKRAADTAEALAAAKVQSDIAAAVLAADIGRIKTDIADIKASLQHGFVSQEKFAAVESDVNGVAKMVSEHFASDRLEHSAIEQRLKAMELTQSKDDGRGDGAKGLWGYIAGAVGLLLAIASFVVPHWK